MAGVMTAEFFTETRTKGLRRLLGVILGITALLVVVSVPLLFGDYVRYGVIVLGIAVVLGASAWFSRAAVAEEAPHARRLTILTAILTIVFSLPLMGIWIGLITVIAGIGLLVVVVAPERNA